MPIRFKKVEKLTEEQKKAVTDYVAQHVQEFVSPPLLKDITKQINPEADGRSYLGKVIGDYLDSIGINYRTTEYEKKGTVELTEDHKKYIKENKDLLDTMTIAKQILGSDIANGHDLRYAVVSDFIDEEDEKENTQHVIDGYKPPTTLKEMVALVNRAFSEPMYKDRELSNRDKRNLQALRKFLKSPRISRTWKSYTLDDEKESFIVGLIRILHDKFDTTEAELNLYIDLVTDQTDLNVIRRQKNLFDEKLESIENDPEGKHSIALAETIKGLVTREDQCRKLIEKISGVLDGTRKDRMKNNNNGNVTFASLVEAWREEETRAAFLKVAEKNRELLGEEIQRLDSLDDLKAAILGFGKEDLLDG